MSNDEGLREALEDVLGRAHLILEAERYFAKRRYRGRTVTISEIGELLDECDYDIPAAFELFKDRRNFKWIHTL